MAGHAGLIIDRVLYLTFDHALGPGLHKELPLEYHPS